MKQCVKCEKVKPICEFNESTRHMDGFRAECRACAGAAEGDVKHVTEKTQTQPTTEAKQNYLL